MKAEKILFPPSFFILPVKLGDLLEFTVTVRASDSALLQVITGFWPPFLLAFALRLFGFFRFPFLDEEDRMVRVAVNSLFGYGPQGGQTPFWENLLFHVPLSNSQGITPLWWWTNYLARLALGSEELSARLATLLFGLIGLALFCRLARSLFAPPVPVLLAWLLAVHDIYLWTGIKAQYPETFLFTMTAVIAWALILGRGAREWFVAAVMASVAALGYFLLKGITIAAGALAVTAAQFALSLGWPPTLDWKRIARRAPAAALIALPLAAWLLAAQNYITARYQVRVGELGYFQGIPQILYALTAGYGTGRTASLVGPWYFAFVVYSQGDAWPISAFLFPLMVAGWGAAVITVAAFAAGRLRSLSARSAQPVELPRPLKVALYAALIVPLTLAPVALKGSFGERYHVLYLAAALIAVGLTLEGMWHGVSGKWGVVIGATGLWVGIGLSWADWVNGVLRPGWPFVIAAGAGMVGGAIYGLSRSLAARRMIVAAIVGLAVILSLARGPLHWGQYAAFGPEPGSWILERIERQYHP